MAVLLRDSELPPGRVASLEAAEPLADPPFRFCARLTRNEELLRASDAGSPWRARDRVAHRDDRYRGETEHERRRTEQLHQPECIEHFSSRRERCRAETMGYEAAPVHELSALLDEEA
jgi:hypothetical protein